MFRWVFSRVLLEGTAVKLIFMVGDPRSKKKGEKRIKGIFENEFLRPYQNPFQQEILPA